MSTQMSSMLEESYQIFQRIFTLLQQSCPQINLVNSQDRSKQIDRTFEESVIKPRQSKLTQIVLKLQNSIVQFIKNENQQALKYEEQLQDLQEKLRKQAKAQIENRLLVEALQEENFQLRREILTLKEQVIELQNAFKGTQTKMKTQIKTLQTEISHLKRLDHLIWDNNCQKSEDKNEKVKINDHSLPKNKNLVSLIKNRLSLCDPQDFQINLCQSVTPNTQRQKDQTKESQLRNFQKKEPTQQPNLLTSRKSSAKSLHRKSDKKQIGVKQLKNIPENKTHKKKKSLLLNQLQSKITKHSKAHQNRAASKQKLKK